MRRPAIASQVKTNVQKTTDENKLTPQREVLMVDKVEGGSPGEQRTTDEDKLTPQRGILRSSNVG
jgi:hypothetical protein